MKGVKFGNKATYKTLSPLEKDVLNLLWKVDEAKVKDIHDKIKKKKDVAYTSVAVILDRLHDRKLVKRKMETCRGGYRYIYSPSTTKDNYRRAVVHNSVDKLIKSFGPVAVAYFNERFGKEENK